MKDAKAKGLADDNYPDPSDLVEVNKALCEQVSELCSDIESQATRIAELERALDLYRRLPRRSRA